MKLGEPFLKILSKTYEPSALVNMKVKRYDIAFKTDENGNPVLLFLGKLDDNGRVRGQRFVRTLKKDRSGNPIKDYWDLKGKAT